MRRMAAQCVVGALLLCAIGGAQPPQPAPAAETSPVVLDGVTLFRVRGVSSFPAERRAAGIAERIEALADNPKYTAGSLRIVQEATHSNIVFEETVVTSVTDLDAAQEGIPVPLVAQTMVRAIDEGVTRYRAERSPAQLRRDAFLALGITLAFLAAGYIFLRLFRFVESYFERIYQARISKLGEQTRAIVEAGALRDSVLNTLRVLRVAILSGGVLIWLNLVLGSFPWTRPFSQRVVQLLVDPLTAVGLGVIAYVPNLAFLIVLFFVIRLALRLTELFFNAVATGTIEIPNFASEWAIPTFRLARFAIGIFALVIAYPYLPGSGSDAFKGLSLFVGAVISFGSSGVIGNVIAGYSLIYRRAYRIGDRVQIGEHIGDVELMRMQVTHLRSIKNEEIIVPNSLVLNSTVINYSSLAKQRGLILHTTLGIGYEVPWRQVESLLLMAASRTRELLSQPPPFVIQKSLGDFAVVYELNVYCDQPDNQAVLYGKLHRNILDVFNEFGVQIMTPAYEGDPETPKIVPKERWFQQPAETNDHTGSVVKTPGRTRTP